MLKLLIKLALAAMIANATWRLGSAYLSFYRFKDSVTASAQYGSEKPTADLQQRVLDLASEYDVPLAPDGFTIRRDDKSHTIIDGSYRQPVDLLPGYQYPWLFTWHVDVITLKPTKFDGSSAP